MSTTEAFLVSFPQIDPVTKMANDIRWFTNKLGPDLLGQEVCNQVNDPTLNSAIALSELASGGKDISAGEFPPLYNILPTGVSPLLRELGFIQKKTNHLVVIVPNETLQEDHRSPVEIVHLDKPFVARIQTLSIDTQTGLFNVLTISNY